MPNQSYYQKAISDSVEEYRFSYLAFYTFPQTGVIFSDTLGVTTIGELAFADSLKALNEYWLDSLSGAPKEELIDSIFNDCNRHRKGEYGIIGFIDDTYDIMPINVEKVRVERADDNFIIVIDYIDHLKAKIKLQDINQQNLELIAREENLTSFGSSGVNQ